MKYVLMFADSVENLEAFAKMPDATRVAALAQVTKWFEEHGKAGRIVATEGLLGPSSSTTVRIKNGKAIVTDGPFIETKEIVNGFAIIEVKDLDEALAMAKTWPGGGDGRIVEVRPVAHYSKG
jgi:hypothetical protein